MVGERAQAESKQADAPSFRMPTGSWEAAGTFTSPAGSRWAAGS